MSRSQRLGELELQLTPQQAVIRWMREAHQFASLPAYVASLLDEGRNPLGELDIQVRKAARAASKGRPKEMVDDAMRQAVRDVLFLSFLHAGANGRVMQKWQALHLMLGVLRCDRRAARLVAGGSPTDPKGFALPATQRTVDALLEILGVHLACKRISARYFGGEPVLFPHADEGLQSLVDHVEDLALDHNLGLKIDDKRKRLTKAQRAALIDLDEVRAEAQDVATGLEQLIIAMAKAEALGALGNHEQAAAYVEPYIRQEAGIELAGGDRG